MGPKILLNIFLSITNSFLHTIWFIIQKLRFAHITFMYFVCISEYTSQVQEYFIGFFYKRNGSVFTARY